MRAGAAQIKVANRRVVPRPSRQRPRDEELIERKLAVKNVAARQAVLAFEIEWRDDLPRHDRTLEARRVLLNRARGDVTKPIAFGVPRGVAQLIGRELDVRGH